MTEQRLKPYPKLFVRYYDFLVYNRETVEAGEVELDFISWMMDEVCSCEVHKILDVGCGNGRFLIPLVRRGFEVVGLDNSPEMLEECRRRLSVNNLKAELIQFDLENMNYEGEFDALICMDSVICYLLDAESIIETLTNFQKAIRPNGFVILENWNMFSQWELLEKEISEIRGNDLVRIDIKEKNHYNPFTSIWQIEMDADILDGDKIYKLKHTETLRAMTVGEMRMYLREGGFSKVTAYSDFDRSKSASNGGENMIFVCENDHNPDEKEFIP